MAACSFESGSGCEGEGKREFRLSKDSYQRTFQGIFSRISFVQLAQKHFGWGLPYLFEAHQNNWLKKIELSHFWVILVPSWHVSGMKQPKSQLWLRQLCLDFLCVTQNPLVPWGPWSALGRGGPTHPACWHGGWVGSLTGALCPSPPPCLPWGNSSSPRAALAETNPC